MRQGIEEPKVVKNDDPFGGTIETHPSYAQINANRVTGGAILYGSDFEHQNFITISISRSKLMRSLSSDHHHSEDELIEVMLSEAQWATFVSSMNQGGGTCCTINHLGRKSMPGLPVPKSRRAQFESEFKEKIGGIVAAAKELEELIEEGGRKTVMRDLVQRVTIGLESNLKFLVTQFGEFMEDTTEKAKIEITAWATNLINRTGIKALGNIEPPIKMIEEVKDGKDKDQAKDR